MKRSPADDLVDYLRKERGQPILWQTAIVELEQLGKFMPDAWTQLDRNAWNRVIEQEVQAGRVHKNSKGLIGLPAEAKPEAAQPAQMTLF